MKFASSSKGRVSKAKSVMDMYVKMIGLENALITDVASITDMAVTDSNALYHKIENILVEERPLKKIKTNTYSTVYNTCCTPSN
jgi:hypothetical protein